MSFFLNQNRSIFVKAAAFLCCLLFLFKPTFAVQNFPYQNIYGYQAGPDTWIQYFDNAFDESRAVGFDVKSYGSMLTREMRNKSKLPANLFLYRNKMPLAYQIVYASFLRTAGSEQREWALSILQKLGTNIEVGQSGIGGFNGSSYRYILIDIPGKELLKLDIVDSFEIAKTLLRLVRLIPPEKRSQFSEQYLSLAKSIMDVELSHKRWTQVEDIKLIFRSIDLDFLFEISSPKERSYFKEDFETLIRSFFINNSRMAYGGWGFANRKRKLDKSLKEAYQEAKQPFINLLKRDPLDFVQGFAQRYEDGMIDLSDFSSLRWTKGSLNELSKLLSGRSEESLTALLASIVIGQSSKASEHQIIVARKNILSALKRSRLAANGVYLKVEGRSKTFLDFDDFHSFFKRAIDALGNLNLSTADAIRLIEYEIPKPKDLPIDHFTELQWKKLAVAEAVLGKEEFHKRHLNKIARSKKEIIKNVASIQYIRTYHPDLDIHHLISVVEPKFLKRLEDNKDNIKKIDALWSKNDFFMLKLFLLAAPESVYLHSYLEEAYFGKNNLIRLSKMDALNFLVKAKRKTKKLEENLFRQLSHPGNYDPSRYLEAYVILFGDRAERLAEIIVANAQYAQKLATVFEVLGTIAKSNPGFLVEFKKAREAAKHEGALHWKFEGLYFDQWILDKFNIQINMCKDGFSPGAKL